MKDASTQKRQAAPAAAVPLLDLARQFDTIRDEVMAAIERVCRSQKYILGPEVQEFEREAAAYCGAREAVGCASGTDALWLALLAAGVQPGDEVITSAFTFFASASTIARTGARPVLMDVDPETLNLSAELVGRRLSQYKAGRLRAVMPVHLFGQCADMDAFSALGREHGLAIIEDAAQAFGAAWRGQRAGSLGTSAGFSFYPTKNLSAFGDGGLVTTNDPACAERLRVLRNHGSRQRYYHDEIGWNSRLDSVQAAVLRVKLKYLDGWNNQRRQVAATYKRLFTEAGLADRPDTPVRLLGTAQQAHHVYHQYVVRVPRRDELRAFLTERKIGTEIYYPLPLHLQKAFVYLGYGPGDLPGSEQAAKEVLALPIFPELTLDEQRIVVDAVADFYS